MAVVAAIRDDELSVERYHTEAVGDFTAGLAGDRSVEQHHVPARLRDGYALLAGVSQDGRGVDIGEKWRVSRVGYIQERGVRQPIEADES